MKVEFIFAHQLCSAAWIADASSALSTVTELMEAFVEGSTQVCVFVQQFAGALKGSS